MTQIANKDLDSYFSFVNTEAERRVKIAAKQPVAKPMFTVETQNPHKFKAGEYVVLSQSTLVVPWDEVFLRRSFANFSRVCLVEHVTPVNIHAGGWILTLSDLFNIGDTAGERESERERMRARKEFPQTPLDHLVHPEVRLGCAFDLGGLR